MSSSNTLHGCVSSLRSSMQLLDSSIRILDSGVNDFPRLSNVLQTTRHFELLPHSTLRTAQDSLISEIAPEVTYLLSRAESYLDKLERREKSLIAKCELQEGRLSRESVSSGSAFRAPARSAGVSKERQIGMGGGGGGEGLSRLEEVKVQQLRQKKERLSYAVGRLELQASQRERQLRKSMAAQ